MKRRRVRQEMKDGTISMAEYQDRMGLGDNQREPQTLAEAEQAFSPPPPDAPVDESASKPQTEDTEEGYDPNWRRTPHDTGPKSDAAVAGRPTEKPLWDYLWGFNCIRYRSAAMLARDLVEMGWRFPGFEPEGSVEVLRSILAFRDLRDRRTAEAVAGLIMRGGFERRNDPPEPGCYHEVNGSHRDLARFLGEPYDGLNDWHGGPALVAGRLLADGQDMLLYPGDFLLCTNEGIEVLGPDRRYPTGQVADYQGRHAAEPEPEPEAAQADPAPNPLVGIMSIVNAVSPEVQEKWAHDITEALRPLSEMAKRMRGEDPEA